MKGCRALTDLEVSRVSKILRSPRDRALWVLGVRSGFRISELLSLKVSDVKQFGRMVERVRVESRNTKGKQGSRSVALHQEAKSVLEVYLDSIDIKDDGQPLFKSRKGEGAITRNQAWRILKDAFNSLELQGKLATHSMRKSFCQRMYLLLDKDVFKTQQLMGHKSLSSTANYLSFNQKDLDEAVLK